MKRHIPSFWHPGQSFLKDTGQCRMGQEGPDLSGDAHLPSYWPAACLPTCSGLPFPSLLFGPQKAQQQKPKRCTREGGAGSRGSWHQVSVLIHVVTVDWHRKSKTGKHVRGPIKHTPTQALKKKEGFRACSDSLLSRGWSGSQPPHQGSAPWAVPRLSHLNS